MKFLIITQYFLPETGAPPNRLFQLARRLKRLGVDVQVLTAMPNYPEMKVQEAYRGKFYHREVIEDIVVHRCWIYAASSKAMVPRLLNYFSFVFTSMLVGVYKPFRPEIIFCESPPLFLGISAYLLTKIKSAKLIFNVSDLWPESAEKLGLVKNRLLLRLSTLLEGFLYRHSLMVTGQTQGIIANISARFPEQKVHWLKNGVDLTDLEAIPATINWRKSEGFGTDDFLLLYAGILGHAQGLEVILQAASLLTDLPEVKFLLVGSGPVRDQLLKMKEEMKLENVLFYENRPKPEVIPIVRAADIAVIPLRKIDLFKGAIPSKIFENLALRKPILLGVEGEAKDLIITQGKAGWAFEPGNAKELADQIRFLFKHRELLAEAGNNGLEFLKKEFDLDKVAREFLDMIIERRHAS